MTQQPNIHVPRDLLAAAITLLREARHPSRTLDEVVAVVQQLARCHDAADTHESNDASRTT